MSQQTFNFSEEHDKHEIQPINAKMKVTKHGNNECVLEVQACGKFITLHIHSHAAINIDSVECSEEFITKGINL